MAPLYRAGRALLLAGHLALLPDPDRSGRLSFPHPGMPHPLVRDGRGSLISIEVVKVVGTLRDGPTADAIGPDLWPPWSLWPSSCFCSRLVWACDRASLRAVEGLPGWTPAGPGRRSRASIARQGRPPA